MVAVNASAERAENAASSATESAASAEETLIEIKRVADGISEDIENANTAKSELSDTINSAEEKKKELESSIGKAGETKTSLDSAISSAGEKQLALDATVEQANAVDGSLKEHIGSAEQIQANVEQIAKNKADISSLSEDLAEVKDKKITKFYASNQGEMHLADSDNGKIQDMIIYGKSSQDGVPTPDNPVEIKSVVNPTVKVCGKNLLGLWEQGFISTDNGISVSPNVYWIHSKEYTKINAENYAVSSDSACRATIYEYDRNKKYIKSIQPLAEIKNAVYTPSSKCAYIKVGYNYKGGSEAITPDEIGVKHWIQFEFGSTATAYEPYHEQNVTLPYTLNAIPVSSGGNVTIDGQQYIADRVVEKDGVFGIERNIREIHTNTKTMNNSEEYPGWNNVEGVSDVTYYNEQPVGTSRILTFISNFTQSTLCQNNIKPNNIVFLRRDIIGYSQSELIAKAIDVDMYIRLQDAIFEPLPGNIQAKLRTLVTNYPVTNISVTSDQLDGYTVFNYPISMANGWNYVKQQLNDNRDYIYDMDIQSAEAYVNSEYAVALTELEV